MTLEGRPVLDDLLQGEFPRLRQTHDKPAGQGRLELDRENRSREYPFRSEVESAPIAAVGNPTV